MTDRHNTDRHDTGTHALGSPRDLYAGRLFPTQQIYTCSHTEHLFPTRTIQRGDGPVSLFDEALRDFSDLTIETADGAYDLFDYVGRNRVTALLVLDRGKICLEHYEYGLTPQTRWMSMSIAKSFSTSLVGAAIHDGLIGSLDDGLVDYLPVLKGGAYDGVTIRQLLQMTSGAQWNEEHTDRQSERHAVLELQLAQEPGAILNYMSGLPRLAEPGSRWNYSTGETHVVGELLRAATGSFLADYLTEKIWSKLGMEADAEWWLESPGGLEVAGSGISATLRDYARFGRFIMNGGAIDGEAVLPADWVAQARGPIEVNGETVPYGFMWWPVPSPGGAGFKGGFSARGIFGQYLYLNPAEDVLIMVWSARAKPRFSEVILDNDFFNAVVTRLRA